MNPMRLETDSVGTLEIDEQALYGIHAVRARMNFPDTTPFHPEWYQAVGSVKKACYQAAIAFFEAVEKHYGPRSAALKKEDPAVLNALLVMDDIVKGDASLTSILVTWASLAVLIALLLAFAHRNFSREDVIFRS